MKKVLLASVATIATVSAFSAFAADLPSRKAAPVYAPPPPMWTGFYAGLNAGYNFGTNSNAASLAYGAGGWDRYNEDAFYGTPAGLAASGVASMTQSGFIGGGQVGYNYQYGSNVVLGLEADIQGTGIRGTGVTNGVGAFNPFAYSFDDGYQSTAIGGNVINAGVDWMGTVRGRIGYLVTPTMLVYATGGLTYGGVHSNVATTGNVTTWGGRYDSNDVPAQQTFVGGGRQSNTLVGWNAGGGVEWMFMPNWSLKAEAFYWDMGSMNVNTAALSNSGLHGQDCESYGYCSESIAYTPVNTFGTTRVNFQGVTARAGVNYHFNWGAAPVVAAY